MHILRKPRITKKLSASEKEGQYCFVVSKEANKVEIKKLIEKLHNVTVSSINTMRCPSKGTRRYTRKKFIKGQKAPYKKAIVTLVKGDSIDLYQYNA